MNIKNEYKNDQVVMYQADAFEFLKEIKVDGSKFFITDPPYYITKKENILHFSQHNYGDKNFDGKAENLWDHTNNKEFSYSWISFIPNILDDNDNVLIFNCWENLGLLKKLCEDAHITIKRPIVLEKLNPSPVNIKKMFSNTGEFGVWGIYNSKDKPTKWIFNCEKMKEEHRWQNFMHNYIIPVTIQHAKFHPTMKDIRMIKYLIELLSSDNATIIDPFAGSFITALAVMELNKELPNSQRKFIGCELETEYFNTAVERIKEFEVTGKLSKPIRENYEKQKQRLEEKYEYVMSGEYYQDELEKEKQEQE